MAKRRPVEHNLLIRVRVLCNLLVKALEEPEADAFSSPQLLEQLREVGTRAGGELAQRASTQGTWPSMTAMPPTLSNAASVSRRSCMQPHSQ